MKKKPSKTSRRQFPVWAWILALVIVLAGAAGVIMLLQRAPSAASLPSEISVAQAAQMRDQGAFILDVRQPEEWASFHIPGATLIPLGELPNRLSEVPGDKNIVVVCRTGHRSAQGRDILLQAGYRRVTSMAGGVTQWQADGLPIATGQ